MRLKVDKSPVTAVVVCACGWRTVATTRHRALIAVADHERDVHPDDRHARTLLWKETRQKVDGLAHR